MINCSRIAGNETDEHMLETFPLYQTAVLYEDGSISDKNTYLIGNFKIETKFLLISMHLCFMESYKPKQTVYQTSTEWSLWVYSPEG